MNWPNAKGLASASLLSAALLAGCASQPPAPSEPPKMQAPSAETRIEQHDLELLELVNQARASGHDCDETYYPPVPPLRWNEQLAEAAALHTQDLFEHRTLSHTGHDGSQIGDRVTRTGYKWKAVGENVAQGQTSVRQVMQSWLGSPGHCANIMSADFAEMGAAYVVSPHPTDRYWGQVFGAGF
jgi:uncharacterized protein YkwD